MGRAARIIVGLVGFGLAFMLVYLSLLLYSMDQGTLWLPLAFGLGFYGVMSFAPKLAGSAVQVGATLLFTSVSVYLWLISGTSHGQAPVMERVYQMGAVGLGVVGAIVWIAGMAGSKKKPRAAALVFLVALACLVSYYSSSKGGADPMIEWVMQTFGASRGAAEAIIVVFRKAVHLTYYAVVALLGFAMARTNGAKSHRALQCGLTTALLYACFDEMRQSTMPDRGGSILDVALDMVGAGVAMLLVRRKASAVA